MIKITVKTYANLRKYTNGQRTIQHEAEPGTTVNQILDKLGVPVKEARIIFVNGRAAALGDAVNEGDKLDLFSAIGGG